MKGLRIITVNNAVKAMAKAALEAPDHELLHGQEDELHQRVLHAIAKGHPQAVELAKAALKTKQIKFNRWYA